MIMIRDDFFFLILMMMRKPSLCGMDGILHIQPGARYSWGSYYVELDTSYFQVSVFQIPGHGKCLENFHRTPLGGAPVKNLGIKQILIHYFQPYIALVKIWNG